MEIQNYIMTTSYAPTQIEAVTDDNRPVYIRYRDSWLTVEIGKPNEPEVFDGFLVLEVKIISDSPNSIEISKVKDILYQMDFDRTVQAYEKTEKLYQKYWEDTFKQGTLHKVGSTLLTSLIIDEIPWSPLACNRVGQFNFEHYWSELNPGILLYFFEGKVQTNATLITGENIDVNSSSLIQEVFHSLDVAIEGVTGGQFRCEVTFKNDVDKSILAEKVIGALKHRFD